MTSAVAITAAIVSLGVAGAATASEGSIPVEVSAYASDPAGLLATLDDLAGVGADGSGLAFDETSEVGQLNRVFVFTDEWLAGESTETPVAMQNLWTAPVAIDDEYVGLAIIWINPGTVTPELAEFYPDGELALALSDVPAESYLVRDEPRGAWFFLTPPDLAPAVAGASGVAGPMDLDEYQDMVVERDAAVPAEPVSIGWLFPVLTIVALGLVVVLVLAIPALKRRHSAPRHAALASVTPAAAAPREPGPVGSAVATGSTPGMSVPRGKPPAPPTAKPAVLRSAKPLVPPTAKPATAPTAKPAVPRTAKPPVR
jgi:hypothetical protein